MIMASSTDEITSNVKSLQVNNPDSKDINILLLGETGVGKSTFINAIANYLHFADFKSAKKSEELLILIPATITLTDKHYKSVSVKVGNDNNEYREVGVSATQHVKTYVFPLGDGQTRIRLIDTPGMGDTRGIKQDDENCENILNYLGQLKEVHAICFLMNPTTTRLTVSFEYCVKQILSRLEKSASKNLIFVFTNSRGTNYTPGETLPILTKVIDDIKAAPSNVEIPLSNRNLYSFDNEAFRYLVGLKNNVEFDKELKSIFKESWEKSAKECSRLITYIVGDASHNPLKPHQIQNTVSINEARRMINQLSRPLADVSQLINDNLRILERHTRNLGMENQSLDALKKKLHIPVIDLKMTTLKQPVTVCATAKCAESVQDGERSKWHYKQRCHDPCHLTNVGRELIGDPGLRHCAAMSNNQCIKCGCDYLVHMHVYYMTTPTDGKIEDEVVKKNITDKEAALRESRRLIGEIQKRKTELENERDEVVKTTALFAHFLQHNAITPFNDSYAAYINYLIIREEALGPGADNELIQDLETMLKQYEETKAAFDASLKINQQFGLKGLTDASVNATIIMNSVYKLYKLKHNGMKIKQLLDSQKNAMKYEHGKTCEYIHSKTGYLTSSETENKQGKKHKKKNKTDLQQDQDKKKTGQNVKQAAQHQNNKYQWKSKHYQERNPPPPYPGPPRNPKKEDPQSDSNNITVKVELKQPGRPAPDKANDGFYQQNPYDYKNAAPYQYGPQQGPPHYGQHGPNYGHPPGPHYGPPGPHYGQPAPHYGQPGPHYGQPGPHYGQSGPNYGALPGNYQAPYGHEPYYDGGPQSQGPPQRPHYGQNWGQHQPGQNRGGANNRGGRRAFNPQQNKSQSDNEQNYKNYNKQGAKPKPKPQAGQRPSQGKAKAKKESSSSSSDDSSD